MAKENENTPRVSSIDSSWTIENDPQASSAQDTPLNAEHHAALNERDTITDSDLSTQKLSAWQIVVFSFTGVLYLIFTFLWLSWAQYYSQVIELRAAGVFSLDTLLQQMLMWFAPLAPALWFLSAYTLTRGKSNTLMLFMLLGLVVLMPWPVFFEPATLMVEGVPSNG